MTASRGLENSESEVMLLEPISRIIDRGYVLTIFSAAIQPLDTAIVDRPGVKAGRDRHHGCHAPAAPVRMRR
jgi:hypothetical protein